MLLKIRNLVNLNTKIPQCAVGASPSPLAMHGVASSNLQIIFLQLYFQCCLLRATVCKKFIQLAFVAAVVIVVFVFGFCRKT